MIINPLSYPGNKNKLVSQITPEFPENITKIVEVFCGSGVVSANSRASDIVCNDILLEATQIIEYLRVNEFTKVASDIEKIIYDYHLTYTRKHEKGYYIEQSHEGLSRYNKDGYNQLKAQYNKDKAIDKLVVLMIYGFNHYIRFNSKREFNVPVGKVDFSESIYNNLQKFVNAIKSKKYTFSNCDFRDMSLYEDKDAFYYFDPPYLVTTAPYNINWDETDEKDLLDILDWLNTRGTKFALSNVFLSNGKENAILIEWSKKYRVVYLNRQYRNANYQKVNVTDTIEVLITNY